MLASSRKTARTVLILVFCFALSVFAIAQTGGNSGSISGVVVDSSGAVIADATLEIHNPVSGYDRTTTTDGNGTFSFSNVPFNPYHMTVAAKGFVTGAQDVEIRSTVPTNIKISLQITGTIE